MFDFKRLKRFGGISVQNAYIYRMPKRGNMAVPINHVLTSDGIGGFLDSFIAGGDPGGLDYTFPSDVYTIEGLLASRAWVNAQGFLINVPSLASVLASGNDASGAIINNVGTLDFSADGTNQTTAWPGSYDLTNVLTSGDDAGGMQIQNLSAIRVIGALADGSYSCGVGGTISISNGTIVAIS